MYIYLQGRDAEGEEGPAEADVPVRAPAPVHVPEAAGQDAPGRISFMGR